jgi:hypothetical protein
MPLNYDTLEIQFAHSEYGLSARRIWEHLELGQVDVFGQTAFSPSERHDATRFIDVIWMAGLEVALMGFTLFDLRARIYPEGTRQEGKKIPCDDAFTQSVETFVKSVSCHLEICAVRRGTRNQQPPFLPVAGTVDTLGIFNLFSELQRRLRAMGNAKATAELWASTIGNFQTKGLRAEELVCSGLMSQLQELKGSHLKIPANELADLCDFQLLRMCVIPVVRDAKHQLRFAGPPHSKLSKTKNLPKAQAGQERLVARFDPVLGYRLEKIEHQTLWGRESHWQAVTYDGNPIGDPDRETLQSTIEIAAGLATVHAQQHFPKRVALGSWSRLAWSGGEEYREWLVTLPYFHAGYFSSHFNIRNVLLHVRCDIRLGSDGERVLLLQEVQSDWAQNVRRAIAAGEIESTAAVCPPFLKEWPALAMKLMLLHAVNRGLHAIAWTRGAHQAFRYKGLGANGLVELYDRTLPREVNRMMKPFGVACERMGVFVPTNFSIRESEAGYEVFTAENQRLGTARTLEDARELVPDGGHELLYEVHGVRLTETVRESIIKTGFPAWG